MRTVEFYMPTEIIPCVAAILYTTARQVLLIQRDEKPGLEFPGYWTLPGGRVEENETPQVAILRELQEEIGVVPEITFWKKYERPHHRMINNKIIVIEQHVYVGTINIRASEIVLNEGQAVGYFAGSEFVDLRLAYGFDQLLLEFLKSD
jgi:8-oxo-dGTP diphosphatase